MKGPQSRHAAWWLAGAVGAWAGWRLTRRLREADLADQVALITGGSRGLGLLLARELAREGCRIVICARDREELDAAVRDLRARGADAVALPCDVSDPDSVRRMVARATDRFGRIDLLVNNAGVIQAGPLASMTLDDFRYAMGANYWGTVHTTLEVLPQMRDRGGGRIVNITSIGGKVAVPHLLPYDCAKFATVGFSEGIRAELARDDIAVTTIIPGLMRTGSPVNALFKGDPEKEFSWFSLASATPLTTMSAERAARRIVRAAKRGEATVTLTWQAKLLRLAHDLVPGPVSDLLGAVNRLLPDGDQVRNVRGMRLDTPVAPSPLTTMMNRAARDHHEYEGRPEPDPAHADSVGLDPGPASNPTDGGRTDERPQT